MQTAQIGDFGRSGDCREWALEIPKIRRDREISHVCLCIASQPYTITQVS